MWRWSCVMSGNCAISYVFSTYVEVILVRNPTEITSWSILHVCGGDPDPHKIERLSALYSPRMWRWSRFDSCYTDRLAVFSTYVEVILCNIDLKGKQTSILHVCGGDPTDVVKCCFPTLYSPRMWRWSSFHFISLLVMQVFSTYVEVILKAKVKEQDHFCILHVCGGDPWLHIIFKLKYRYSPRMWRWSSINFGMDPSNVVFSTYVEVILWLSFS